VERHEQAATCEAHLVVLEPLGMALDRVAARANRDLERLLLVGCATPASGATAAGAAGTAPRVAGAAATATAGRTSAASPAAASTTTAATATAWVSAASLSTAITHAAIIAGRRSSNNARRSPMR
jgi:hypothetical protein